MYFEKEETTRDRFISSRIVLPFNFLPAVSASTNPAYIITGEEIVPTYLILFKSLRLIRNQDNRVLIRVSGMFTRDSTYSCTDDCTRTQC